MGLLYSRETMERNIRDIVKDSAQAESVIKEYFEPVHRLEAERNRMKIYYRERVKGLNLSRSVARGNKVSEAYAVQYLGEAEDNIAAIENSKGRVKEHNGGTLEDWRAAKENIMKENPNLDWNKVQKAVGEFREIYNELFEKMNEARIKNGYEPVDYRRGYFPHFRKDSGDTVLNDLARALGIDMQVTELPTTINGLTHTFKPGIRWFGNALQRTGFDTDYDAVEGFDRYIEGATDVIMHTDDIQKLRALEEEIRYKYSDESIKKQVRALRARTDIAEEDRQSRIDDLFKNGPTKLSNFAVELHEYTNLLANKKADGDRNLERKIGRTRLYNIMRAVENHVAVNMSAINPASWLTNLIPLTQGGAQLKSATMLRGMWDTLKSYKDSDGLQARSVFLTNRRGSDPIVRSWNEKASTILTKPMEFIDHFTADTLVRARYYENMNNGMNTEEALNEADSWTAGVMADRSKGAVPTIFKEQNPLTKLFTQFQVEVNNKYSYLFKDLPREQLQKGVGALAMSLVKFFLGAWLYNELYEKLTGRRAALDPIGILNDAAGDLTGYKLPNIVDLGKGIVTGNMPSFQVQKKGFTKAAGNLVQNVEQNLPFVSGVVGGGRLPIASALPDLSKLLPAGAGLVSGEMDKSKALDTIGKELIKPAAYIIPPFGGGQIKKAVEGIGAVSQGGSFTTNSKGEKIMQFPIYNSNPLQTAKNYAQAAVFGKSSLPMAVNWVKNGFNSSTARETTTYQTLVGDGVDPKAAYETVNTISGQKKTDEASALRLKKDALASTGLSEQQKASVYYTLLADTSARDKLDEYVNLGLTQEQAEAAGWAVAQLKPEPGETGVSRFQKITALMGQSLTKTQRTALVASMYTTRDEDGKVREESLLPYLRNSGELITMYRNSGDGELISMTVPEEFSYKPPKPFSYKSGIKVPDTQSVKVTMTEREKTVFRNAYARTFDEGFRDGMTAKEIKALRGDALEAAKAAVVTSRG